MTQYINEGVAYLMALKQGGQSGSAGSVPVEEAPAAQSDASADEDNRFQGAEKRRSLRYKCEGSVELREKDCDVRTWATFSDISLHGCYVEAQATYPPGTVLHLRLEANTIRVEAQGLVRVTYPYLGMGISFEEMTEESKASLRRLLATLSYRSVAIGGGGASSTSAPLQEIPAVSDPVATIQALVDFFQSRQALLREEFVRILNKSQGKR